MERTKGEKLGQLDKEIAKVQQKLKELGQGAYGEWADGGDGWHDERRRETRLQYQIFEAHLKTLKQEKSRLLKKNVNQS